VSRSGEAVGAGVRAAAVDVDRVVEAHVGAVVVVDDGAGGGLLEDLLSGFGRLTDPLDVREQPRVGRVLDGAHRRNSSTFVRNCDGQSGVRPSSAPTEINDPARARQLYDELLPPASAAGFFRRLRARRAVCSLAAARSL